MLLGASARSSDLKLHVECNLGCFVCTCFCASWNPLGCKETRSLGSKEVFRGRRLARRPLGGVRVALQAPVLSGQPLSRARSRVHSAGAFGAACLSPAGRCGVFLERRSFCYLKKVKGILGERGGIYKDSVNG